MCYCGIVIWELDTASFHICGVKLPILVREKVKINFWDQYTTTHLFVMKDCCEM